MTCRWLESTDVDWCKMLGCTQMLTWYKCLHVRYVSSVVTCMPMTAGSAIVMNMQVTVTVLYTHVL